MRITLKDQLFQLPQARSLTRRQASSKNGQRRLSVFASGSHRCAAGGVFLLEIYSCMYFSTANEVQRKVPAF
ncbi:MAG TPA: hypothetical protein VJ752_17440 [Burkholderiaceae bacterium]|nr:hypothetical protein [Burkholderiaceae bacterium]